MNNILEIFKDVWHIIRYPVIKVSGSEISLLSVITAISFFYGSVVLSRITEKFAERFLREKTELDHGVINSIKRFTRYVVLMIGAVITLETIGISLSSLAALGAVLMVGIGFGLQNITQNFISGLIILLERPIKIGDLVEVEGVRGKVEEIGARSTRINTRNDISIIVPNSQFISEQVVNQSFSGNQIRLAIDIGVSYGSDPDDVRSCLIEVAKGCRGILTTPPPKVLFKEFADSSLNFSLMIWVNDLWDFETITSDVRFAIFRAFKEKNIQIPFPQMDVHVQNTIN